MIKARIEDGQIDTDEKKTLLIASIPFYRNLCEYSGKDDDYLKLTCFLHQKTLPLNTDTIMLSDLWSIVRGYLNNAAFCGSDELYCSALQRIATSIIGDTTDEVCLENKLLISIATRLTIEEFLKRKLLENGQPCVDGESNQTREWFKQAESYLTTSEKNVVEEVNLITPESIHLNAFMYEPLIDISSWTLKDLYQRAVAL